MSAVLTWAAAMIRRSQTAATGLLKPPLVFLQTGAYHFGMKEPVSGIPWCRSKDYERLLTIFEDSATFPTSYNEWIDVAEAKIRYFEKMGKHIVKVPIDPNEFPRWCASNGYKTDAKGRIAYVAKILPELVKQERAST